MRPLQTILRSTSFPRAWWTRLGSFVRVSSRLSLTVYLNLSFCEQRSTFLFSVVFHAGNLSDWHHSSVHRGHFYRNARDISIYQGDDDCSGFQRNSCVLRVILNSIHKVCFMSTFLWRRHCANIQPVAKRLQCAKTIEPWKNSHTGSHIHTREEGQPFHFCEIRYVIWGIFVLNEDA